jgi:hypothetical protein
MLTSIPAAAAVLRPRVVGSWDCNGGVVEEIVGGFDLDEDNEIDVVDVPVEVADAGAGDEEGVVVVIAYSQSA